MLFRSNKKKKKKKFNIKQNKEVYWQQGSSIFKKRPLRSVLPKLKRVLQEELDAELSSGQSTFRWQLDLLLFLDCHHSFKLLRISQHIYLVYNTLYFVWVQLYSCAVTLCASAFKFFSIIPCCLGLPGPCKHPVQHPDDLWSLTCRRPAGCPVVHGSQLVDQHLCPCRDRDRLGREIHLDHAVHRGLSIKTQLSWFDNTDLEPTLQVWVSQFCTFSIQFK